MEIRLSETNLKDSFNKIDIPEDCFYPIQVFLQYNSDLLFLVYVRASTTEWVRKLAQRRFDRLVNKLCEEELKK